MDLQYWRTVEKDLLERIQRLEGDKRRFSEEEAKNPVRTLITLKKQIFALEQERDQLLADKQRLEEALNHSDIDRNALDSECTQLRRELDIKTLENVKGINTLRDADERIVALEAENGRLKRELGQAILRSKP